MRDDEDIAGANTVAGTVDPEAIRSDPEARESAPSFAPPHELVANRYEIQTLLGVGGMGRVYRALDRRLDEVVALKVLRRELVDAPGMLERFRQEVKLARRVTSPHVVRTFDLGEHGADHFLTMEYVEGKSLAALIDHGGQLPIDEVLLVARGVCSGMAAAHAAGVLHRDLKPDNVLVARSGRIAITDFGIARASASPTLTTDRFVGTPAYMAPEQVTNRGEIGPHTDVYAFGAILFEMLAGRRPFPGADLLAVATARLLEPPPDPRAFRSVPDVLATLVLRCLARESTERYASGSELAIALAAIQAGERATRAPGSAPMVPIKSSRSVALLPLRAAADLAELAEGLAEEIVDALSMTRDLRVRPLASVRSALGADKLDSDPRELGKVLGVDVVVDGSLRKLGAIVRISARVIGTADGFQLWANRFDTTLEGLIAVGDDIARAVAAALTADLAMPAQHGGRRDPRATEHYLEGKAKLRVAWRDASLAPAIVDLEAAHALAPDDPDVLAALAMAFARVSFQNRGNSLPRAMELAERAVTAGPSSGETWLALAFARLYAGRSSEAAFAAARSVVRAPGLAVGQSLLGTMLLEAGALDDATAHLEAAHAVDPITEALWDLARAHAYAGRYQLAAQRLRASPHAPYYTATQLARFRMWQGEVFEAESPAVPPGIAPILLEFSDAFLSIARTRHYDVAFRSVEHVENLRLRSAFGQMLAEAAMFASEPALAMHHVETVVAAGLQDLLWIERCPLLQPIRSEPAFVAAAETVRGRAEAVLEAVRAGLRDATPPR